MDVYLDFKTKHDQFTTDSFNELENLLHKQMKTEAVNFEQATELKARVVGFVVSDATYHDLTLIGLENKTIIGPGQGVMFYGYRISRR